ncbi:MAG: lantibiotic dehydratase family protein [Prevotellaceae bacterium]|jgi:hypothetical protein|nr:lantibiotic dehydratase family protein [Prevotellaceae bacterium]
MNILNSNQPFSFFIFRTPLFPFGHLKQGDEWANNNLFSEALLVASPDLSEGIEKEKDRAQFSAYRYYQRACTRPTPFGLFAGCSVGAIGERTEIKLLEQESYRRTTRLDMNYICALTQQIERDHEIRQQLCYFPNSSIYAVGNNLRYVEYHYRKTSRVHQITQVDNSDYLQGVLALANNGTSFIELAKSLVDDNITLEDATEFIHELIDSQVLISELEPAVTNVQPLTALISKLTGLPNSNIQAATLLSEIKSQLTHIDQQPIGVTQNIYPVIIQNVEQTKVEAEIKYLFQTDMYKPVRQASVSQNIINDIQQTLLFLNKITSLPARSNLSQFKENFYKRYEEIEMPLLFVLDNELGIGYAGITSGDISPLVDDLALLQSNTPSDISRVPIQSILLQKYQQSMQKVIELTDEDVKGIEAVWDDLPPTISVMCQILQDDAQGRSVYLQSTGGQSAANLLGRFCHLDEQILNHTLAITAKEAQMKPDVIFAEIVHLPESRIGNILLRPVLRPYEIPYLAKSGVSQEFEIGPDDLYVSIKNNRIVLRSKRLNKKIIPRMSTAHNFSGQNSMPVYYFLCDMQHQTGRSGLWFSWQDAAQNFDYLPRVVYKNAILSQARWTVREKEIKQITGIIDDVGLLEEIEKWQIARNMPDTVVLADGDNELFIDLKNPLSIRAWLSVVKKRPIFQLEEFLFDPETAVVHGPEGVFTNEFIFAFYRKHR